MRSRMIPNVIYMCLVLNGFHIVAEPPLAERGCAPAAGLCGQHWADGHADCARPAVPRQLCGRLPAGCAHLSGSCAECCLPLGELLFTLWDCASPSASYSLRHMQSCWVSSILIHEALTRTEMHDHCYVCCGTGGMPCVDVHVCQVLASWTESHGDVCLQGVELGHPRAGSAPAFLHTSAPLGGYGGFGMYSSPYGTAFNTGVRQKLAPVERLLHLA